jgi:CRISPR-associated protein Csx10
MIALTFTLELKESLLMTAVESDPNSAVSLSYVPGSALRGALVGRYLTDYEEDDLAADAEARKLFFDAHTRYLNAYPVDDKGKRTLPTPNAWKKRKGDGGDAYTILDLSVDPAPQGIYDQWQPKPIEGSFCDLTNQQVIPVEPDRQVNIHTLREPKAGRATLEQGAVFRYEALAPGQKLAGVILCPDADTADTLQELLEEDETLLLGGSQSAGYGLTTITEVKQEENWQETPHDLSAPSGHLTITLLSDAILRDADGQYTAFLTPEILAKYLNVTLTPDRSRTFAETGVVGGFNRKWGLPLPQTPVARSGSVFTFEVGEAEIPIQQLQTLFEEGIGERRAEGFGRVAVNWHTQHATLNAAEVESRPRPPQPVTLTEESTNLAQAMATRMLRRQLDQALRERVLKLDIHGEIHNTQLSAVRTRLRTALATGDASPITTYLDEMKSVGQEQFEKARIKNDAQDQWIKTVLDENASAFWKRLFRTSFKDKKLPAVGEVRAVWDGKLAQEYALRLIDGVLNRELAKRRKEDEK